MRTLATLGLVLIVVLSGCLSGSTKDAPSDTPGTSDSAPGPKTGPTRPDRPTASYGPRPTPTTNGTTPEPPVPQSPQPPWPEPESARIRPGIQTFMEIEGESFQCTSNFVYRSPDNSTLYLGTAAHCVDGLKIGDPIEIDGATKPGRLAYSAWMSLKLDCNSTAVGSGCTGGDFENDFALIEIDAKDRPFVSPAVLHFGGPTALMDSADLDLGDRVLAYGHSGLWGGQEDLHHHEGVVTGPQGDGLSFYMYTVTPGVQGDSGSGVLTRDGRAAGVLVTLSAFPPGETGVTGLLAQLELAKKHGMPVLLATWEQLDDGIVPG